MELKERFDSLIEAFEVLRVKKEDAIRAQINKLEAEANATDTLLELLGAMIVSNIKSEKEDTPAKEPTKEKEEEISQEVIDGMIMNLIKSIVSRR
jgi:hypothetical protein